jgi:hypothetical protein
VFPPAGQAGTACTKLHHENFHKMNAATITGGIAGGIAASQLGISMRVMFVLVLVGRSYCHTGK